MKQIMTFAASVVLLPLFISSVGSANLQSKDRDNPTRLSSNEISGLIGSHNVGDSYYYGFTAGPGEITLTLTVEAGREERINFNLVHLDLFDEDARTIASKEQSAGNGLSKQAIVRLKLTRRERILLRIIITELRGTKINLSPGKYRLRFSGAITVEQANLSTRDDPKIPADGITDASLEKYRSFGSHRVDECLPNRGILRIKMKDGSIRTIDLSQAEEILIEP